MSQDVLVGRHKPEKCRAKCVAFEGGALRLGSQRGTVRGPVRASSRRCAGCPQTFP